MTSLQMETATRTASLKIEKAALIGRKGYWSITLQNGFITEVAPVIAASAQQTINAKGSLVIPGLVDPHLHLDKALLLEQHPAQSGDFQEALEETFNLKRNFTIEDIQTRARKVLESEIAFGTTAIRGHVEVDPVLKLTSMKALLPLKQEYVWGMTLQLAVFAQEGITNQPGTEAMLREAMAMGGDVIGSAPYTDTDPERNIRIVFDIAQAFDCDVDFHLDFLDDDAPLLLPVVARETIQRGWQNRVCLGHMTRLAGLSPTDLTNAGRLLSEAGISVLALPSSDLYMMARKDSHNIRRGVAPIQRLIELGVNGAIATNNIQNLFTPFGDGDPLKICTLIAQTLQLGTVAGHRQCLEMVTVRAARAIGIHTMGIAPGKVADLVILEARSASEAIGAASPGRTTIKQGRIVSETTVQRTLKPA